MDKINIISSQTVLEMSSFSMDTRSISSSPLVNSLVKNRLFKTTPDVDEPPFQVIHCPHYGFVCGRHNATWQPRSRNPQDKISAVWRPQVGRQKLLHFLMQQFSCCTWAVRCAGALSCWNTKSLPDTLRIAGSSTITTMSLWSSIKEVSERYHQNFLLCNNNKITACIADLFNSFCEEVYAIAFLKVVQQQTIGEVGHSVIHLWGMWADNFCLQQWKNY